MVELPALGPRLSFALGSLVVTTPWWKRLRRFHRFRLPAWSREEHRRAKSGAERTSKVKICILKHTTWNPAMPGIVIGVRDGGDQLSLPERLRDPTHVFVATSYDLFTRPASFIATVFGVMNGLDRHDFQLSTRFPERASYLAEIAWTENIWLGAIVEAPSEIERLAALRNAPASTKFVHFRGQNPLPNNIDLEGVDFVIVEARDAASLRGLAQLEQRCSEQSVRLFVGDDLTTSTDARNGTGRHFSPLRLGAEEISQRQLWVPPRARRLLGSGGSDGR